MVNLNTDPTITKLEEPYEWFEILYPTRRRDRNELKELIAGPLALSASPFAILDYLLAPAPGFRTPLCKSVLVERRYRDRDHTSAMAAFYHKSFRPVESECIRLHFFSRRIAVEEIGNLESQNEYYLGFCVLRPFPFRKIGRSIIKNVRGDISTEFPICDGVFEVNIGGSRLELRGTCFMEQDTQVSACASVAIWMSAGSLHKRYNLIERSTSEITNIANEYLVPNRPMPSEGLVSEQMVHVFREMGYDPLFVGPSSTSDARHLIYSCVESRIPPVLLMSLASGGNHSVVAISHRYQSPVIDPEVSLVSWPEEEPLMFMRSSQWAPEFLVNDDQRGPFRPLRFLSADSTQLRSDIESTHPELDSQTVDEILQENWRCPVVIDTNMPTVGHMGGETIGNIWGIIIPFPQGVTLESQQAESKAGRMIRFWHWQRSTSLPVGLVLRTYLIESNEYKRQIESTGMNLFVRRLYRGKPMPRWIWVTEISSVDSYNSASSSDWKITGEVIIDATSNPWTLDFVAFHYINESGIGVVTTMQPDHADAEEAFEYVWGNQQEDAYSGIHT